jgi:hypothetical protein
MQGFGEDDGLKNEMRGTVDDVLLPVPRRRLLLYKIIRLLFSAD